MALTDVRVAYANKEHQAQVSLHFDNITEANKFCDAYQQYIGKPLDALFADLGEPNDD